MNKHILIAMDWKNRSKEELRENYDAAVYSAAYSDAWAAAVAYASYAAAFEAVAYASYAAAYAEAAGNWLDRYFEETGEDREDYEKALEDMRE